MKQYDKNNNRLVFRRQEATSKYWDANWRIKSDKSPQSKTYGTGNSLVEKVTERYLRPNDGPILEGGCGRGHYVKALVDRGYESVGVDFAEDTIKEIRKEYPYLNIKCADVRNLPFPDQYFAGYWSLGVIEHFWEGYIPIAKEMARVIKPSGYLFLTFPQLSYLRKLKALLSFYESLEEPSKPYNFYQFALDPAQVIEDFQRLGFKVVYKMSKDGLKGTKDEIAFIQPLLQMLYDYKGRNLLVRVVRKGMELVLAPFAGHSILIIFEKSKEG